MMLDTPLPPLLLTVPLLCDVLLRDGSDEEDEEQQLWKVAGRESSRER